MVISANLDVMVRVHQLLLLLYRILPSALLPPSPYSFVSASSFLFSIVLFGSIGSIIGYLGKLTVRNLLAMIPSIALCVETPII